MRISIATAYHNRKDQLMNTIKSIIKSRVKDFQMVIVDDASDDKHRIDDIASEYDFIKLIRINKEDKWYVNPCIPFNVAIDNCDGDIVILQNPECYHVSDIMAYVNETITENDYFSFGCFSLDQNNYEKFNQDINQDLSIFLNGKSVSATSSDGWYNHSRIRPTGYHFTSAIYKHKLIEVGKFDEDFAYGVGFDDDELLFRIRKRMNVKIIDDFFVFHQYHYQEKEYPSNYNELINRNRQLFNLKKQK